jgi:hypothetical protein
MDKKLAKTAAFVALFAFMFLLAPAISSAKPAKIDFRTVVKKPVQWISSFLGVFTPIFGHGKSPSPKIAPPDSSSPTIKPLIDDGSVAPSKKD